ncbi:hypothetical protein [Symbiopectobacterium purcellii]|uniref:hypothetical protein n=1 Tax=Symbiopectobacterium purcellii TaxID=2871826 RepID=UPI003F87FDF5
MPSIANRLKNDYILCPDMRQRSIAGCYQNNVAWLYMGGLLNRPPTQFMEFADGALNITSPNPVNITCSKATVAAPQGVTIDTPSAHFTGDVTADGNITDNAGTQASSLKMLRDNYNDHKHPVRGVQPGSSSVISNATDKPS